MNDVSLYTNFSFSEFSQFRDFINKEFENLKDRDHEDLVISLCIDPFVYFIDLTYSKSFKEEIPF